MEDNCAVTLENWRTIVLLHLGNGGKLYFYTWEMGENCTFTLGKLYIVLYSLHLEKGGKLFLFMEMGGHIIIKLQCTYRKWRDKLCSLHVRNVGHQKWTHWKMAGEIVHLQVGNSAKSGF